MTQVSKTKVSMSQTNPRTHEITNNVTNIVITGHKCIRVKHIILAVCISPSLIGVSINVGPIDRYPYSID